MDMKGVVDFNKNQSADVSALLAGNDILLMPCFCTRSYVVEDQSF